MRALSRRLAAWTLIWTGLTVLIGGVDYLTGPSVSMTLFYLVPTVLATWLAGRASGVFVALSAGLASFVADYALGPSELTAPTIWNLLSRIMVLAIAALVVDRLRADRARLLVLDAQRSRSLDMLDQGLAQPARQMVELLDRWDGSAERLTAMIRPRAAEIAFLASDFASLVRAQSGQLHLRREIVDLTALVEALRAEHPHTRDSGWSRPVEAITVLGDPDRLREGIAGLLTLAAESNQHLSLSLTTRGSTAHLSISDEIGSGDLPLQRYELPRELGLRYDLARLLIEVQGGRLEAGRRPFSKGLYLVVDLPLATGQRAGGGSTTNA